MRGIKVHLTSLPFPSKSIVIYDGDCGICETARRILEKLDFFSCFEAIPLQNEKLYDEFHFLSKEECLTELKLIQKKKDSYYLYGGVSAVLEIMRSLPLFYLFTFLFFLPFMYKMADWFYKLVAKNRHKISKRCGLK